ncbi:MAG: hypothetical protein ACXWV0_00180 [Flavisolibacter sp.]
MRITTLRFSSLHLLWKFRQHIGVNQCYINANDRLLTCCCTEEQVQLAVNQYRALEIPGESSEAPKKNILLKIISAGQKLAYGLQQPILLQCSPNPGTI